MNGSNRIQKSHSNGRFLGLFATGFYEDALMVVLRYGLSVELMRGTTMKIVVFVFGLLITISVSAESLEERVKTLESKVSELQEMIVKLSVAALETNSKTNGENDSSTEDSMAALMFLAAMKNTMEQSEQEREVNIDCIKELDAKIKPLEQNSAYTNVGWMLKYESTCDESIIARVNLAWYTSDGFLLEKHSSFARFDPKTKGQVSGEKQLFSTEKYEKIGRFTISLGR